MFQPWSDPEMPNPYAELLNPQMFGRKRPLPGQTQPSLPPEEVSLPPSPAGPVGGSPPPMPSSGPPTLTIPPKPVPPPAQPEPEIGPDSTTLTPGAQKYSELLKAGPGKPGWKNYLRAGIPAVAAAIANTHPRSRLSDSTMGGLRANIDEQLKPGQEGFGPGSYAEQSQRWKAIAGEEDKSRQMQTQEAYRRYLIEQQRAMAQGRKDAQDLRNTAQATRPGMEQVPEGSPPNPDRYASYEWIGDKFYGKVKPDIMAKEDAKAKARMQKKAERVNWLDVPAAIAEAYPEYKGKKLPAATISALAATVQRGEKGTNLVQRQITDKEGGKVTTIWSDPTTGEEVRRSTEKITPKSGSGKSQLMLVPGPDGSMTATEVRPGMAVPEGSVSPTQYGSTNVPTAATRGMAEKAPKVTELIRATRAQVQAEKARLGPAVSRWREFWTGKVGASDPGFMRLRTNTGLLETMLMNMHVGARGSEKIMEHFSNLLGTSKQDPDNFLAALEEIQNYTDSVAKSGNVKAPSGQTPKPSPDAPKIQRWGRDANGNPIPL